MDIRRGIDVEKLNRRRNDIGKLNRRHEVGFYKITAGPFLTLVTLQYLLQLLHCTYARPN